MIYHWGSGATICKIGVRRTVLGKPAIEGKSPVIENELKLVDTPSTSENVGF